MRESWTDGRMDDLSNRMDRGFDRVDADVADLSNRMDQRFKRVDADMRELRTEMNTRFDALQRTLIQLGGGLAATLIGLIATQF